MKRYSISLFLLAVVAFASNANAAGLGFDPFVNKSPTGASAPQKPIPQAPQQAASTPKPAPAQQPVTAPSPKQSGKN